MIAWISFAALLAACSTDEERADQDKATADATELSAQEVEADAANDPWVEAVAGLEGVVAEETLTALHEKARARVKVRRRAAETVRQAQFELAAAMVTEGDNDASRAALDTLDESQRAAIAGEAELVEQILSTVGPSGVERLKSTGALEAGVLDVAKADVRALAKGARQMPLSDASTSEHVGLLLLQIRYGLAADAVVIDSAVAGLELAIEEVDGLNPQAPGGVTTSLNELAARSVRFQREKYRYAVSLRAALSASEWVSLLQSWSLVDFVGCIGCVHPDDGPSASLADQLLGIDVHTASGGGASAPGPATSATSASRRSGGSGAGQPGARMNQGQGIRPIGGG